MTLVELLELLKKRWQLVVALPLIFALIAGAWAITRPDVYTATTTMYVLSKQADSTDITSAELSASQQLTNDIANIVKSSRVRRQVAEQTGLESLSGYSLNVSNTTNSRVVTLTVTGRDPQMAADVANAFVSSVSEIAQEVMGVEAVNSVDEATVPVSPSGPKRMRYVAVGLAGGLFAAVALVVLLDLFDTCIRNSQEVEELLDVPVIGHFPAIQGV